MRNFFTVLLLSPGNFGWAKHFLSLKVTSCLVSYDSTCVELAIPSSCLEHNFACLVAIEGEGRDTGVGSSKDITIKKRHSKRNTSLVESEVRSPRLKKFAMGFKIKSCTDRSCLACGTVPQF